MNDVIKYVINRKRYSRSLTSATVILFSGLLFVFMATSLSQAAWWDTSWGLNIPLDISKPTGYESSDYSNKLVSHTVDFSAIDVDNVDQNSIRVLRYAGAAWTELSSNTDNWLDQDSDGGYDSVVITFMVHANDLNDITETNVTYYIYFDIMGHGSKSAPGYPYIGTVDVLCVDLTTASQICEELATITQIANLEISVSISGTISDLAYANLVQYDVLYFGWNAVSDGSTYKISGYETDIKNFANQGGRVLSVSNSFSGFNNSWLPEPGTLSIGNSVNPAPSLIAPFNTTIFAYPNTNALTGVTLGGKYTNNPASYTAMADKAGSPLFLRKYWGSGVYVLGTVMGESAGLAGAAHKYLENSIYWAVKWTDQPLVKSVQSPSRYSVTSITIYQSDYTTPLTSAEVGETMYVELIETDLDDDTAATIQTNIHSDSDTAGINITLSETAVNSGRFRGGATLASASNEGAVEIESDSLDIVTSSSMTESKKTDTLTVASSDPSAFSSIDFKSSATYATTLTDSVSIGSVLYIQVIATDTNAQSSDIVYVKLTSQTDPTGITADLVETGRNTGIFRGTATVTETSNDSIDYIGAADDNTIVASIVLSPGLTDSAYVASSPPASVTSVNIYQSNYSTPLTSAAGGATLYIELVGVDGNQYGRDYAVVTVYSSITDINGISVSLQETTINSGIFRGTATLGAASDEQNDIIGSVKIGETITAESIQNALKKASLTVSNTQPTSITSVILKENATYSTTLMTGLVGGATMYIELTAGDLNNQTRDKTNVTITSSTTDPVGISVTLEESGANTGKFRGTAVIMGASNDINDQIGAGVSEIITIKSVVDITKTDTVQVISSEPTVITSTTFMSDGNYDTPLSGDVTVGGTLYIEVIAVDINPNAADAVYVKLTSLSDVTGITVMLTETGANTGQFDGYATVKGSSDDNQDFIKATSGDSITAESTQDSSKKDTVNVTGVPPKGIFSIAMYQADYTTPVTSVYGGNIIYVEALGVDGNTLTSNDITTITVTSNTDPTGITATLTESGGTAFNTRFRGTVQASNASSQAEGKINAAVSDTITITSDGYAHFQNGASEIWFECEDANIILLNMTDTAGSGVSGGMYILTPQSAITGEAEFVLYKGTPGTQSYYLYGRLYPEDSKGRLFLESMDGGAEYNFQSSASFGAWAEPWDNGHTYSISQGAHVFKIRNNSVDNDGTRCDKAVFKPTVGAPTGYGSPPVKTYPTGSVNVNNSNPTVISSVVLKTNATYATTLTTDVELGFTLYIQLNATDANQYTVDSTTVSVVSSVTDPTGINVTLTETAVNSGIFRGTAIIAATSNDSINQIGAATNETITITSDADPSKQDVVTVDTPAAITLGTVSTTPVEVSQGQTGIVITFTASNSGTAEANISAADVFFTNDADFSVTPDGGNPTQIAGGASGIVFTFTAAVSGSAATVLNTIDASITATDALSNANISNSGATVTDSFTVVGAAAITSSIANAPSLVSQGQTITVTMTVNNTGEATANAVTPSALTLGGTSSAVYVSGPTPANAVLAGGGNQIFTWTYTAGTSGTVNFSGNASGSDANSGNPVSSVPSTSSDISIQSSSTLTSSMAASPSLVNQGGTINVTLTINNTGGATANSVTPTMPTIGGTSSASLLSGPTPASANISGGGNQNFSWTYSAASQNGTVNFTSNANGTDANSGSPVSSPNALSTNISVQLGCQLNISMDSSPVTVSGGQAVTVTMTVSNTGDSGCNAVTPSAITKGGTSNATYLNGPSPANANIPGGGNQIFTWTYSATTTPGTVNFTGNATGNDAVSGSPISSTQNTSNDTTIETKASITANASASPSVISTGQTITVVFSVDNTGQADATGVTPSALTLGGAANATLATGPIPASATIAGGGSQDFTWTYTADGGEGTVNFTGSMSGSDENSGNPVSTSNETSNTVTVQAAASLSHTISATPATANLSQLITITMNVSNNGSVTANSVTPSALTPVGTSGADYVSGPTPASANIAGGGNQDFTWTYTASAATPGTLAFSGSAGGTDANSGNPVNTGGGSSTSLNIQTPAALTAVIDSVPDMLGVGDSITVTMTVTNTGQASANTVTPSSLTLGGTGSSSFVSGPFPASANISGGGNQDFTWIYTAASIGSINYTGNASGTDNNDDSAVSSPDDTSNNDIITSNPDAVLSSSISASPSAINTGSNITVTMTVTNVGDSSASNVVPSSLTLGGTGAASLVSGPSPTSANLSSNGGQQAFTWTYSASSAGTVNFTGNASGGNDGIPPPETVYSGSSVSNNVTVSTPASLTSSISIPAKVNRNQNFTVTMTVNNTGGTTANTVAPSALTVGGTSGATLVSGPTPGNANIAGGGNRNFTWTYTAGATSGSVGFTGNASGTDANSSGPVSSTSNSSNTGAVQSQAAIAASIAAAPATVSGGQQITITLSVGNSGEATAQNVVPASLTLGGTSGASFFSGPSPASASIAGGGNQNFTWIYTANNTNGTVNFTSQASGTDANNSSPVSTTQQTTSNITTQKKTAISSTITATPGTVSSGQTITVTMTVNNTGTATAINVTPSSLTLGGTSSGTSFVSGPTPASASIAGGANQQFSWTYTAGSTPGTVNFTGNASCTDINSGSAVNSSSNASNNVTIQGASALTSSLAISPTTVSNGQTITVTMTVNNTGQAAANAVAPSSLTLGGTSADASIVSGPTPASAVISGGGNQQFTWTYTAGNTTGTINFTGNATGTDANSGDPVSSSANASNDATIQQAAILSTTIEVTPVSVPPTGQITITMKVSNTGGGIATWVIPSSLTIGGTGVANFSSGPTPGAFSQIAAGNTRSFVWKYTAGATNGTLNFSGNASGTDAYSSGAVSSTVTVSNTINISPLTPAWIYPSSGVIGAVRSSASVRNDAAYIGSDDNFLYSLNANTGALRWKHDSRDDVVSWPYLIDWGTKLVIYYGSMGNYAYAINDQGIGGDVSDWGTDGVNVGNRIVSTTVTDGIRMYFGCYDDKVHALDVTNGTQLWVSQTLGGDLISSPSVYGTELFIGSTDGKIYALNVADGTYLRDFNTGGSVEGLPWVDFSGNLLIGSSSGKFYSLKASNLTQNWVYPASGAVGPIISSPWAELGKTYFGSNDGKLYCVKTSDGTACAGFTPLQTGSAVRSSPLVWDGVVYFGSDDGKIYAVDSSTGALLPNWPYDTGGIVFSSPGIDWVNNRIIIGSNIGKIFCFNALTSGQ